MRREKEHQLLRSFWENRLEKQAKSGKSISAWCLENKISRSSFHYWKKRLKKLPEPKMNDFVEIKDKESTFSGIHIKHQDIGIYVERDFDAMTLKQVLSTICGSAC